MTSTPVSPRRTVARFRTARRAIVVLVAACTVAAVAGVAGQAAAATSKAPRVQYALALGDSLATGGGASAAAHDYASLVTAQEASRFPGLQLVDLGCSTATTASMRTGPGCAYSSGTQLGDAVAFLHAHPHQVAFVTIDVGALDVQGCQTSSGLDQACAQSGDARIATNLPLDLQALQAAYPGLPIYGMDYYDPFLASWLAGGSGQSVATQSVSGTVTLNTLLSQIYTAAGVSIADPASLFQTTNTTPNGTYAGQSVPQDVAFVCQWTGACSGGDPQPNDQGHAELAAAFDSVIDAVTVSTVGLPAATMGTPYSTTLSASGGHPGYKWSLVSGTLPPGMHFRGATGVLSGTPKASGIYPLTVGVVDTKDRTRPVVQEHGSAVLALQVLATGPPFPSSGRYSTALFSTGQIIEHDGVQFTSAPGPDGVVAPVLMDMYLPPDATAATPRPTIIEVHGGSFVGGSRTDNDQDAEQWALLGFVAVSIDYRLAPLSEAGNANEPALAAAALPDVQQAVRFLKANAGTYGVDTSRMVVEGFSAGGGLSLATGVAASLPYSGPLSAYSPSVAAVIATGAFLTPALPSLNLASGEAPAMLFQYDYDNSTFVTSAYAFQTCDALRAAGNACYEVDLAGTGHTTWLIPSAVGPWWTSELGPFVWDQLHLATARH